VIGFLGGIIGRVAAGGDIVLGAFLILFGLPPGQLVALLWRTRVLARNTADREILDDVIKVREEADSENTRENCWQSDVMVTPASRPTPSPTTWREIRMQAIVEWTLITRRRQGRAPVTYLAN